MGRDKAQTPVKDRLGKSVAGIGFAPVPKLLCIYQGDLGIRPIDLNLIAQLQTYDWGRGLPYVSLITLAERIGCDDRTVRRALDRLRRKGYLRVIPHKGRTYRFDLKPLMETLEILAPQHRRAMKFGKKKASNIVMTSPPDIAQTPSSKMPNEEEGVNAEELKTDGKFENDRGNITSRRGGSMNSVGELMSGYQLPADRSSFSEGAPSDEDDDPINLDEIPF